jgi:anti-sigma B factor antagonist
VHRIRIEQEHAVVVLVAEGEFDAYAAPELRKSLEGAGLGGRARLVADLGHVSFMDSTALGLLVRAVKQAAEHGGGIRVVLPTTTARRIFEITTLDRVLPVATSRAAAVVELSALDDMSGAAAPGS